MAKPKKSLQFSDFGTPELLDRVQAVPEYISPLSTQMRMRVVDSDEIERLYQEGLINSVQRSVANRLQKDLLAAGVATVRTARFERGRGDHEVEGRRLEALFRVNKAIDHAEAAAYGSGRFLIAVVMENRRVEEDDDFGLLNKALGALLDFYGAGQKVRRPSSALSASVAALAASLGPRSSPVR